MLSSHKKRVARNNSPVRILSGLAIFVITASIYRFPVADYHLREIDTSPTREEDVFRSKTFLATYPIVLLNRQVGTIFPHCPSKAVTTPRRSRSACWLIPTDLGLPSDGYIEPMPVRTRPWMSEVLRKGDSGFNEYLLYYTHMGRQNGKDVERWISVLGMPSARYGPWHQILLESNSTESLIHKPFTVPCESLHSPSIFVNDEERAMLMYLFGHSCQGVQDLKPAIVLRSTNGVTWIPLPDQALSLNTTITYRPLFREWNYLSPPTEQHENGYCYAVARTPQDSVGSAVLCRAKSMAGPFEIGPVLGRGMRPLFVYLVRGRYLFVFFKLVGDAPERILLGTVDTASNGAMLDSDWLHWRLLPGPTIFDPRYEYQHGHAILVEENGTFSDGTRIISSKSGAGAALRSPRFVEDKDMTSPLDKDLFSGLLFYSPHGDQAIAVAQLSINISEYLNSVRFRDHSTIDTTIFNATSITKKKGRSIRNTTLVTGTGRSGTTFICTLFNRTGFAISHDNMDDCGVYPGRDGAASWYDAFDLNVNREYDTALHMVRYPLNVINSRAFRMIAQGERHIRHLRNMLWKWEDKVDITTAKNISMESAFRFSLKHWVRRNSFVQRYAEWRETVEELTSDFMVAWRLCMASYLGDRCPSLPKWRDAIKALDHTTNTDGNSPKLFGNGTIAQKQYRWTWADLSRLGKDESDYVLIAQQMAYEYGYDASGAISVFHLENPGVTYDCGFGHGPISTNWDCWIDGRTNTAV